MALILPVIVVVAAIIMAFLGIWIVRQQTNRIVERFGRFRKVLTPGLHFVIPFIDRVTRPISLRIEQLDIDVETKTEDNVFVAVPCAVQYQVDPDRVRDAYYKLGDPEEQIESYILDIVRAEVPRRKLDDLFTSKDEISKTIKENLQEVMQEYGFIIRRSLITDIKPDERVARAMNSINAAKREREAAEYEAEANKIRMVAAAEAEAKSKELQGKGTAAQREAIADGIARSVETIRKVGVSETEANAMLFATQYFDTLQSVGAQSKATTIFLPLSADGGNTILAELTAAFAATKEGFAKDAPKAPKE